MSWIIKFPEKRNDRSKGAAVNPQHNPPPTLLQTERQSKRRKRTNSIRAAYSGHSRTTAWHGSKREKTMKSSTFAFFPPHSSLLSLPPPLPTQNPRTSSKQQKKKKVGTFFLGVEKKNTAFARNFSFQVSFQKQRRHVWGVLISRLCLSPFFSCLAFRSKRGGFVTVAVAAVVASADEPASTRRVGLI